MPTRQNIPRWQRRRQRQVRDQLLRRYEHLVLKSRPPRGLGPMVVAYGVPFDPESESNAALHRRIEGMEQRLGDDEPRTGRERLRDGLMIAAPIAIFGTFIYLSTVGPERPADWRDR